MKRKLGVSDGKHSPQSHDTSLNSANKSQRKVVSKAFWSLGAARGLRRIFKENLGACERFTPFDRHEKSDGVRSTSGYCALDGDPRDARNLIPIQKNSGVDRAEFNSPAELQKIVCQREYQWDHRRKTSRHASVGLLQLWF